MAYSVERVSERTVLGEGPHWDVCRQTLFYVDVRAGSIHSFKPETKEHHSVTVADKTVTLILPIEKQPDQFIVSIERDLALIKWDGKSCTICPPVVIATLDKGQCENRINDGKADPRGRLFAGTMKKSPVCDKYPPVGSLYSVINKNVNKHLDCITCSNGLAWSKDQKKFYYADSFSYKIDVFDYDVEASTLCNSRVLFDFKANNIPGFPDGLTIDTCDNLFVANYGGAQVLHINGKTGCLIAKIPIPTLAVTSVAFGGKELDELYVTTANVDDDGFEYTAEQRCNAGYMFRVTCLGTKGVPANSVDYCLL